MSNDATPFRASGGDTSSLAISSFTAGREIARRPSITLVGPAGLLDRGIDFSRSHLWRLEQQGRFPRRVHLGNGRVRWVKHEIDEYLEGLVAARG